MSRERSQKGEPKISLELIQVANPQEEQDEPTKWNSPGSTSSNNDDDELADTQGRISLISTFLV